MGCESGIRDKIKVIQPDNPFSLFAAHYSLLTACDVFVVAAYGKIIPEKILEAPRLGTLGVHPSLLPKYRGPSPIQSAILAGEETSGVTVFKVDGKIDHGPILAQKEVPNFGRVYYEEAIEILANAGADLLIENLPKYISGGLEPKPQNHSEASFTKMFKTEDAYVPSEKIHEPYVYNMVRALNPEPGVWTILDGKRVKLLDGKVENGKFIVTRIQEAGKNPLNINGN